MKPTVVVLVHQLEDPVADLRRRHADVAAPQFDFVDNLSKTVMNSLHQPSDDEQTFGHLSHVASLTSSKNCHLCTTRDHKHMNYT